MGLRLSLGATPLPEGRCRFRVWAPHSPEVSLRLLGPREGSLPLASVGDGYHELEVDGIAPGQRYLYRLASGAERPDPTSRDQPDGVHAPSRVPAAFAWRDQAWRGRLAEELVVYELHVGTYTSGGDFAGVMAHLEELVELGVTALQLMPVAPFEGERNWGYDGVLPFAVHPAYGGPEGLRELVDACHQHGLAVVLDVVFNHQGPAGNYLGEFGPYFTDRYRTPWGDAVNFDGPDSDHVRRYFLECALHWIDEYHVDGLRLDAVHAILDHSPRTFLEDLVAAVRERERELRRPLHLLAETPDNDARLLRSPELGGIGIDAVLSQDYHHALHALLTGERVGYYRDYGQLHHLAAALCQGWTYTGQASAYHRRRHGTPTTGLAGRSFVVFAQDHDQVGNRPRGDRLGHLVSFEAVKLAASLTLLAPYVPFLFMGEEYGESAPFPYFVSHDDPALLDAVRRGRAAELRTAGWEEAGPDPAAPATFRSAVLDHSLRGQGRHRVLWELHQALLRLRRETPALARPSRVGVAVAADPANGILALHRGHLEGDALVIARLADDPIEVATPVPAGRWATVLDTAAPCWQGPGASTEPLLTSDGHTTMTLLPWSVRVLVEVGGNG